MQQTPQNKVTPTTTPKIISHTSIGSKSTSSAHEKDLVCLENDYFSTEVKTSSNKNQIFGNRSYAQESISDKKVKMDFI